MFVRKEGVRRATTRKCLNPHTLWRTDKQEKAHLAEADRECLSPRSLMFPGKKEAHLIKTWKERSDI